MSIVENPSTVLFLINDDIRAVRVSYEDNNRSRETIKKTFLQDLKVGDYVLVETDTRWGATVCKVVAVNVEPDFTSSERIGWIFGRAPLEDLESLKAQETQALTIINEAQKRKAKEELRKTIMDAAGADLKQLTAYHQKDDVVVEPPVPLF